MKVDVETAIRTKNPSLYRKLPRFLLSWVKRIVHQDRINRILDEYGHLTGVPFITSVLDEVGIRRSVIGAQHLEAGKRYVFASNHPLGGLDGFVLAEAVAGRLGETRLVVNDILMQLEPLRSLFVPVNKHGKQSVEYARLIGELFASDRQVIYFPAGLCSRKIHGRVTDLEWKKNFVVKALESGRDIVPVFVSGQNSWFFYALSNFRKALGINFNIEMVLLPDELFRQKHELKVVFGRPIPCERLRGSHTPREWTGKIRNEVYRLKTENNL